MRINTPNFHKLRSVAPFDAKSCNARAANYLFLVDLQNHISEYGERGQIRKVGTVEADVESCEYCENCGGESNSGDSPKANKRRAIVPHNYECLSK